MNKTDTKLNSVYGFIRDYISEHDFPPSVREISSALSINSTSTVFYYLKKLEDQGKIIRSTNKNRAITLPSQHTDFITVPLVGTICAGDGIFAVENIENYYPLPTGLFRGDLFMLKVAGDSMIGVGINDGDFLVVRKQPEAENGSIVVALVDETAAVKRLMIENGRLILHPENAACSDIVFYPPNQPNIQGVVVANIHKFE